MAACPVRCVLFDLDGTLLDTSGDLLAALNAVRRDEGLPPVASAALRPYCSRGAGGLVRAAYGSEQPAERLQARADALVGHYRANLSRHTALFEGMTEVLERLETAGLPWGIVTNKNGFLTDPLLEQLGLSHRPGCVISGDTTPYKKPRPEPLLEAARRIGRTPGETVYVGDDRRDIEAGVAAGMRTLAAAWGYLAADDDPLAWQADAVVHHPHQVLAWLDALAA